MKKIVVLTLGILFSFALLSCGSSDNKKVQQSESSISSGDSTIIGTWKISVNVGNEVQTMYLQIYEENGEYYGKGASTDVEKLRKEGNKYYEEGSTFNDYFEVDGDNLYVGDQEGRIDTYSGIKIDNSEYKE